MVYLMSNLRSANTSSWHVGAENLPYGKHSVDLIELISPEAQLFLHARDVCIVQIGAIEVTSRNVSFRGKFQQLGGFLFTLKNT